jgi:hypothetical protein
MTSFYPATRHLLITSAMLLTVSIAASAQILDGSFQRTNLPFPNQTPPASQTTAPATTTPPATTTTAPTQPQRSGTTVGGVLGGILGGVLGGSQSGGNTGMGLSSSEIAQGLKEALRVGVDNGANQASAIDGYFKNALLKILLPPEVQRVEGRLRQLGFGRQMDQFVLSLNRSAEGAARRAKPIFWKAVTSMTIQDAVGILSGQDNAATEYLRRTAGQQLVAEFRPVIDSTMNRNNVARQYNTIATTYNRLPFVQPITGNIGEYVTNKAVDGLFILVAQEEKKIRENPVARVSDILKRVFGSGR